MNGRELGRTQDFVLGRGFQEQGGHMALIARDGSRRLLAEIYADPDRPEARPREAYQDLLASLVPGWAMRLLQLTWPDPEPRRAFLAQVEAWGHDNSNEQGEDEELQALRNGLWLYLEGFPLPYRRRALLEFILPPGDEGPGWWEGVMILLEHYGLTLVPLGQEEILSLARHLLNPELE